ncbi:MAG: L-serine ammonia-lyase [Bacteroidales bacterium]|nr:L-serine ammonia-lyase [Bacteroidales bacterium]MBR5781819.1 L-serine ammonia-lyase [Bacteroidales bacterium]
MKTIKEIYRIGHGPSSSHTMAPRFASEQFLARNLEAAHFEVTLYGSLAATGKGHLTDVAILDVLEKKAPVTIVWQSDIFLPYHPNGMTFKAFNAEGVLLEEWTVYSVGGGALEEEGKKALLPDIYPITKMTEILNWCEDSGKAYWEYVNDVEDDPYLMDYLEEVWNTMKAAVERGLQTEGRLPGPLNLPRKAANYHIKAMGYQHTLKSRGLVFSYALAVSEENASGGLIVTAPTCGSCGVLPAVLYHGAKAYDFAKPRILRALATAALVGNLAKTNASISGAEVGCQGEVGVACAMAAAAVCQLFGGSCAQIEYAAEMALEHHLGMTCDPVCGLVQIPCIERNAFAAARAMDANIYATFTDGTHRVSYDKVVDTMKRTGHDMPLIYRETSTGGLASDYVQMDY